MQTLLSIILLLFSFNLFSKNIILHIEGDQNKEIIEGINLSLKKYNLNPLSEKLSNEIFKLKKKKYGKCSSYKCLKGISKIIRIDTIIVINILEKDSYYIIKSGFIDFSTDIIRKKTVFYNKKDNNFKSLGKESTNYLLGYSYKKVFYLSKEEINLKNMEKIEENIEKKVTEENIEKKRKEKIVNNIIEENDTNTITTIKNYRENRLGIGASLGGSAGVGISLNYFLNSFVSIDFSIGIFTAIGIKLHAYEIKNGKITYFSGVSIISNILNKDYGIYLSQGLQYSGKTNYFSLSAGPLIMERKMILWGGFNFGLLF